MFVYLFIAGELAVLYLVFWYLYLREPGTYTIVDSLWGRYAMRESTTGGAFGSPGDEQVWRSDLTEASGQDTSPSMSMLPSFIYGDPDLSEEFRRAARLYRQRAELEHQWEGGAAATDFPGAGSVGRFQGRGNRRGQKVCMMRIDRRTRRFQWNPSSSFGAPLLHVLIAWLDQVMSRLNVRLP